MHPAVWYRGWTAGVMMSVPMTVVQFGGASGFERAFLGFGDLVSPRSSGATPSAPDPFPRAVARVRPARGRVLWRARAAPRRGHDSTAKVRRIALGDGAE